ncbi:MAG: N-acetylmuramoyl-L-alanine amidase [Burkholderiaceae bacterium]|nr:N-acetylmuramoyl-L-alanine amidase [Burkholderiaceae bacterium]
MQPHNFDRRRFLQSSSLALLLGIQEIARGASILAVRVWPAEDYTRITIESDARLQTQQLMVGDPPRLAIDIEGISLHPALRELVGKVKHDDPYIAGLRIGQNMPTVVRIVFDLKKAVQPQIYTLTPVAAYNYRLVLDLFPARPTDPMESLIAGLPRESSKSTPELPSSATPPRNASLLDRLIAQRKAYTPPRAPSGAPTPALTPDQDSAPPVAADTPPRRAGNRGIAARVDRLIIIALDPGHGGEDPGATGPAGTHEKDVVLQIARRLRARIDSTTFRGSPMRAFMTRDADFFVPLGVRVQKARRVQANLFMSIHADAFTTPQAHGASVFALSDHGASSSAARWLASSENNSDAIGGVNFARLRDQSAQRALLDMSTTAQITDSLSFGAQLLGQISKVGQLHSPRVERAGFAVLKAPDIPSVLVETAFISNPEEEQQLLSAEFQEHMADALMTGILRYFAQNPPVPRSRQI